MREQIEELLDSLDERQQKTLLGVLVERLLRDEDEEIMFTVQEDGQPIGYFLPHDLRMELDVKRLVAELTYPNGMPTEEELLSMAGVGKQVGAKR